MLLIGRLTRPPQGMTPHHKPSQRTDRRRKRRTKSLLGGVIAYNDGNFTANCIIRNVGEDGALIGLPAGLSLPFKLHLIDLRNQLAHEAELRWYRGYQAGLKYVMSYDLKNLAHSNLAYLRHINAARQERKASDEGGAALSGIETVSNASTEY